MTASATRSAPHVLVSVVSQVPVTTASHPASRVPRSRPSVRLSPFPVHWHKPAWPSLLPPLLVPMLHTYIPQTERYGCTIHNLIPWLVHWLQQITIHVDNHISSTWTTRDKLILCSQFLSSRIRSHLAIFDFESIFKLKCKMKTRKALDERKRRINQTEQNHLGSSGGFNQTEKEIQSNMSYTSGFKPFIVLEHFVPYKII